MSLAETLYSFRAQAPDVLQRGRAQRVSLEAYEGSTGSSVLAAPTPAGSSFSLLGPDGTAHIDAQPITVVSDVAVYDIDAAELPDTIELSEMYQERWVLVMPDGTTRTVRREAALALYQLHLPIATTDLTVGRYPNLDSDVAGIGGLQQFLDTAWRDVLRDLWRDNRWPDLMLSSWGFVDVVREKAYVNVFQALERNTGGSSPNENRWTRALARHTDLYNEEWSSFRSRIDHDHDGLPDDRDMESATGVVHMNANRVTRLPRSARW